MVWYYIKFKYDGWLQKYLLKNNYAKKLQIFDQVFLKIRLEGNFSFKCEQTCLK